MPVHTFFLLPQKIEGGRLRFWLKPGLNTQDYILQGVELLQTLEAIKAKKEHAVAVALQGPERVDVYGD